MNWDEKVRGLTPKYEQRKAEEADLKDTYDEAVQSEAEAEERAAEMVERADQKRAEVRKRSFRPDFDQSAVAAVEQKATGLESRAKQERQKRAKAEEAWREAKRQTAQVGRELARAHAGRLAEERVAEKERALAALADAVLDTLPEVLEAEDAVREDLEELRRLKRHADGKQEAELRSYLRAAYQDADPRAQLGVLLRDVLTWMRRVDAFEDVFEEAGIEPAEGSPRHREPVPAVEDALNRIEGGKLPDSIDL